MKESKWKKSLTEALAYEYENCLCPTEEHIFSAEFERKMNKLLSFIKPVENNKARYIHKKRQE